MALVASESVIDIPQNGPVGLIVSSDPPRPTAKDICASIRCFRAPCGCPGSGTAGLPEATTNGGGLVTAEDWVKLGMLGNNAAMNWYVLAHPGTALPAPAPGGEIAVPGARVSFNTNLLIVVGGVAILAWALSR